MHHGQQHAFVGQYDHGLAEFCRKVVLRKAGKNGVDLEPCKFLTDALRHCGEADLLWSVDPDRALALLNEAGYADGHALGEVVLAHLDLWESAAARVAAQLEAIGVRVRLLCTASDSELAATIEGHGHHCYIWSWDAVYPDPKGIYDPNDPLFGPCTTGTRHSRSYWYRLLWPAIRTNAWGCTASSSASGSESRRPCGRLVYGQRILCRRPWLTGMWLGAIFGVESTFADAVVRR